MSKIWSSWLYRTAVPLLGCFVAVTPARASAPVCTGTRVTLDTSIGATPVARLTVGGRTGNFLLDTGATGNAVDAATFGATPGTTIPRLDFALPSPASAAFNAEDMRGYRAPPGGQIGRIGTSILSKRVVALHYDPAGAFAIIGETPCDPKGLVAAGVPGSYAARTADLKPGTPNVPAVFVRIGSVQVPAQIDTGFADQLDPGLVQINAAMLAALRNSGVKMQRAVGRTTLGCDGSGVNEHWQIDTERLRIGRSTYKPPLLEVKSDPSCGGIATFPLPWAQLGASWLNVWGITVFDGPGERIWLGR